MVHLSGLALAAAAAAGSLAQAQVPEGYRAVYMTSMANTKFVVQPKTVALGSTLVV